MAVQTDLVRLGKVRLELFEIQNFQQLLPETHSLWKWVNEQTI